MPIRSLVVTDTYIELNRGDGPRRINFSDISGSTWNAARLNRARDLIQAQLDTRTLRTSLPLDDPDILVNPARPYFFWDSLDLVSRPATVTVVATGTAMPILVTTTTTRVG